jgi:hypothetical protein
MLPDTAGQALVSKALNAPLLDPDTGIRDAALDAARVWATQENTVTLVKLLGSLHGKRIGSEARTSERVARALVAIGSGVEEPVFSLLKSPEELVRYQACWILSEVGTEKSVPPLRSAGGAYLWRPEDNSALVPPFRISCELRNGNRRRARR